MAQPSSPEKALTINIAPISFSKETINIGRVEYVSEDECTRFANGIGELMLFDLTLEMAKFQMSQLFLKQSLWVNANLSMYRKIYYYLEERFNIQLLTG